MKRFFQAVALLATFVFSIAPSKATTVRSLSINELTSLAATIVKAEVLSKETFEDTEESGRFVNYYTLRVIDSLKGEVEAGSELIFKQVAKGEYSDGVISYRQNYFTPDYTVGKTYVFFLPNPHHATGLLAPIGLAQGVFDVIVVNGNETLPQLKSRSRMLFGKSSGSVNMKLLNLTASEPSYANFKSLVESLVK